MPAPLDPYLDRGYAFIAKLTTALPLPWWEDGIPQQQPGEYQAASGATVEESKELAGDHLQLMANEMLLSKQLWSEVVATYCKAWLYGKQPWPMLSLGQVLAAQNMREYALQAYDVVALYPQYTGKRRLNEAQQAAMLESLQRARAAITQ